MISVGSSVLCFNILVAKGWTALEATALCLFCGHASGASVSCNLEEARRIFSC
jgi:hypothetical protein